jgi:serine/threonine-protein kinase
LNQALRFLRQSLGGEVFRRRGADELAIDPHRLWCDIPAFHAALSEGSPAAALELYRGDFLEGLFVPDCPGFEQWMERERSLLRERASRGARELAEQHAAAEDFTLAVQWSRQALELMPDDERALRRLLQTCDRAGDRAGALRAYEQFAVRLAAEYDAEPSAETRALVERLRTVRAAEVVTRGPESPSGTSANWPPAHYRIERELRLGSMSQVYLARDLKHEREVVLKVLRPPIAEEPARERFAREIRIASRLQHPNIVPVFDSGEAQNRLFYVMPYIPGETLRDRLAREGRLPVDEAMRIVREVGGALAYAHAEGVIHRDIKPANILLHDHRVVLTDFGIARAAHEAWKPTGNSDDTLTQVGISLGTPAYMAPEQAAGSDVDRRADLYALGILAYQMLAGSPPFTGETPQRILAAQIAQRPEPLGAQRPDLPSAVGQVVMKCLAKEPADRWQSADELLAALESAARPTDRWRTSLASRRRRRVLMALTLLAAVVAARLSRGWEEGPGSAAAALAGLSAAAPLNPPLPRGLDPDVVAILPFRTSGADPALAYLHDGLAELLPGEFTGEGGPRAVDPGEVMRVWSLAGGDRNHLPTASALELATQLRAGLVVVGAVVGTPRRMILTASLLSVPAGEVRVPLVRVEGREDSLPSMLADLSGRLLARETDAWRLSAHEPGTTSAEALRAFMAGRSAAREGGIEEAVTQLSRALVLDSSFVLAAYQLLALARGAGTDAVAGAPIPNEPWVRRLAWRYRGRLGPEQRLLLEARLPPDGRGDTDADAYARVERAARALPASYDAWSLLANKLFHSGALLGFEDWRPRAKAALEHALALDTTETIVNRLATLAFVERDLGAHRRWVALLQRLAPRGGSTLREEYFAAVAAGNARALHTARERFAALQDEVRAGDGGRNFTGYAWVAGVRLPRREADSLLSRLHANIRTPAQRARFPWTAALVALNAGQPDRAAEYSRQFFGRDSLRRDLNSLRWAERDSATAERLAEAVRSGDGGSIGWELPCEITLSRLRRADTTDLAATLGTLRADSARGAAVCADLLELLAAGLRPGSGLVPLYAADSLLRAGPTGWQVHWTYDLAIAFARRRDWASAASAARRRLFARPIRLAVSLRDEGRWAALAGDTAGAIQAYRHYLVFRDDPEPALIPQRDSVRAELARLEARRPAPR